VTVLFCDVTGSTALGERLDPEALRELLARYFERMKLIVQRHGGTVEKFIGDAVMAVFGIPVLHEDDALRALRAAVEMRDAFPELGVEARIGVTTGEVVTGTEERLATGDAVNIAARLEQAAQPGEILIGEETYRLTRDAVSVDAPERRVLKGKAERVSTYRLLSVESGEGPPRQNVAPMVGREREQRHLASVWDRVTFEKTCQLFTILGAAGVGKSRLVAEFLPALGDAVIVRGRCLSYGDGITYWPIVEIVKQLPEATTDPAAAETIGALVGDQERNTSSEEIAWAFRKRLEAVAAERPIVCVIDDLQWGEPTLLDLIEHLADLSRGFPILVLCTARPDLLDRRTGWGGGKVNATTVLLEPLDPAETDRLIASLADLESGMRTRIREAAEGNPLFVEEMVALLQESGESAVAVPPTIQALLAARLDQLEAHERAVLQSGSIEGRVFHRGAVAALNPSETQLTARLTGLVRKELIRPDTAQIRGEDAYRFRHLLSRDAAYAALPKAVRAELHERFADWLEQHGADLVELDEMLGYHLEQAYHFRQELGQSADALGDRAARRLGAAGRRALDRGDVGGASRLLTRATLLIEDGSPVRTELEVELADALLEGGRMNEAETLLVEALGQTARSGNRLLAARAQVGLASLHMQTLGPGAHAQIQRDLEPLVAVFEAADDHRGAADALVPLSRLAAWDKDFALGSEYRERALVHARAAGDERRETSIIRSIVSHALWGPEPVDSALERCRAILSEASNRRVQANCLVRIGGLEGLTGQFDSARESIAQARAIMDDLGLRHLKAHSADVAVLVEMLAGDDEAAEREARAAYAVLESMGDRTYQRSEAILLAKALVNQGRADEAEEWLANARDLDDSFDDWEEEALRALIAAQRGHIDDAVMSARAALDRSTRSPEPQWDDLRLILAEILVRAGRTGEARQAVEECARLCEAKGIVPLAERARLLLAAIPASP
jgi:class 3 adenylate cyclase/tetratricopeptide (TPR) repeat protein